MKKKLASIIFFLIIISIGYKVEATTISISPSNPKVGDTVTVTVTVPNVNTAKVITNVSGAVSGTVTVVGGDIQREASNYSNSEKFYCDKEGKIDISVNKDSSSAVLDGNYVEVGASTSINVLPKENNTSETESSDTQPEETHEETTTSTTPSTTNTEATTEAKKSSNANLSNLGFTPTDFKGFKPWKTEYSTTVKGDVEQISVYATLAKDSSKAKITSGTGTHKLNEGNNSIKVVVTAEDGTTKTYTINVTREKKEENTTTEENTTEENTVAEETAEQENKNSDLTKLEVVGYTLSPKFSPDIYEYKININSDVNDLDVKAEGANENIQIEIAGNKDLKDGENTITILVHNNEKNTDLTYQIIATKALLNVDGVNTTLNDAVKKANKIRTILIGIVVAIIIGIIIFFIARHKIISDEIENDKYEYDEEDDDTLDLDGEEELFKRVNKEEFKKKIDDAEDLKINENRIEQKPETKPNTKLEDDDSIDEERYEFFRTSIEKRKGKHF